MSHTTRLDVKGYAESLVIHNGDYSGDITIRYKVTTQQKEYGTVVVPSGLLPAVLAAMLQSTLSSIFESLIDGARKELENRLLRLSHL